MVAIAPSPKQDPSREVIKGEGHPTYVYVISSVAALGGLLFGYDLGVTAGAIPFMKEYWQLNAAQEGFVASFVIIGCMVGAMIAGVMSDWLGRKKMLMVSALLFLLSAIGAAFPRTVTEFLIARFIGGIGIGAAAMMSPLYISEVAPAHMRGGLVSINQLTIILGMLISYLVDWYYARLYGADTNWRWMFGAAAVPAGVFMVSLFFVPESPRWLTKNGRAADALRILTQVGGKRHAEFEMNDIQNTLNQEKGDWRMLFKPGMRIALFIGVMLAILQQWTGINSILFYAPRIFVNAGFKIDDALVHCAIVGAVNTIFTFVAIFFTDKLGRKPLLALGALGMGLSFLTLGLAFHFKWQGTAVLVSAFAAVAFFAMSLGPVVWVVISEIFPTRIRGLAMSVATLCLWIACFILSSTFPVIVDKLGDPAAFWLYSGICVFTMLFVLFMVPETKGKSLEEIERSWGITH